MTLLLGAALGCGFLAVMFAICRVGGASEQGAEQRDKRTDVRV